MIDPQELKLWKMIKMESSESAREKIVLKYRPLVVAIICKISPPKELIPDLMQEGMVALLECIDRFDYSKGVKFSTFAYYRIKGRIINYLERHEKKFPSLLEEEVFSERLSENSNPFTSEFEEYASIKEYINNLPYKEAEVIKGIFFEGLTPKQIAKSIGVGLSHVYRLQKKALLRLKKMILGELF